MAWELGSRYRRYIASTSDGMGLSFLEPETRMEISLVSTGFSFRTTNEAKVEPDL